jgi:transposase-like protein
MEQRSAADIVAALREGERLQGSGRSVAQVAAQLGVSASTYRSWRRRYGNLPGDDVERIRSLERENAALRRILIDKELENEALRELTRGVW